MPTPRKHAVQDKFTSRFNIEKRTKEEAARAAAKLKAEREARIVALRNASPSAKLFTSRSPDKPTKLASKSRAMTMEEMMQKPASRRSPRLAQPRPPIASLGARSTLAKKLKY